MTPTQRNIGVIGAVVATFLLMYPPWRLDYEGGYSRIAYAYLFSPPADYGVVIGDTNVRSPQTQSVAVWMLIEGLLGCGEVNTKTVRCSGSPGGQPFRCRPSTKVTMAMTTNTKNKILAMPTAPAAMPPKPKRAAISAITRKTTA